MKKNIKNVSPSAPAPAVVADDSAPSAPLEIVNPDALRAIEDSEIDRQISTAKKYPRDIAIVLKNAESMAIADEDVAASCIYSRPVGTKIINGRKVVEYASGMSIRLAEIVASCYQNIMVYAVLIENADRFVRARGMAFDVQNNYRSSSEALESTVTRQGTPYSERMKLVVAKAALSKARRDAIFQVVPRGLFKPVEMKVREIIVGDRKTLKKRRDNALAWLDSIQVPHERAFAALGITGKDGLDLKALETLLGLRTAIMDGDVKIDEAFPVQPGEEKTLEPKTAKAPLFAKTEGQKKADPPASTAAASSPALKQYSEDDRKRIVDQVKNGLLDQHVDERKAFDHLKGLNLVPDGVEELFAVPTLVLDALIPNIPKLAKKA